MKLPASYKAFLSCSNGMELFCGEEGSSLVSCTIYSLKEALNQIEKFRQIIKNKYRSFLTKKELEQMDVILKI